MSQQMQPIFIMPEDTKQTSGKQAQRSNIAAAKAVADAVRSTLGPKGMDKMIVDSVGDAIVTNDGVTILKEMQIEHPAARMVVEVAKNQESVVGDGTTSSVILAGELLKRAEDLLDLDIHPTILAKGYHIAGKKAQEILKELARPVSISDNTILENIAKTAMTGKGAESNKDHLAKLIVEGIKSIAEMDANGTSYSVDLSQIKVEGRTGDSAEASKLIKGIVLDKEIVHPEMPKKQIQAKIALLNTPLEIRNTEIDAKIQITSPTQLNAFLEQEEQMLKSMCETVINSGATVVFCQKGIDDLAQHYLAKAKIIAVRRVRKADMEKLARATQASIVNNLKELHPQNLGSAGLVREEKTPEEEFIYIEQCPNPKSLSLIIHGATEHIVEENKRAVEDALGDLAATLADGKVVAGAGATEILLQKRLQIFAQTLEGREQLAVQAFAQSLEIIPRTLAENAGIDPIDALTKLKSAHLSWPGINVFSADVMDAWQDGVIEPLKIKTQALASATQVAEMILRIDDVIFSGRSGPLPPQNGMPNMGGMM